MNVWTVARMETRKANQRIAERNQRCAARSRKTEMPIRKTDRKVAQRRIASLVSKAYAVRPVSHWKSPSTRASEGNDGPGKCRGREAGAPNSDGGKREDSDLKDRDGPVSGNPQRQNGEEEERGEGYLHSLLTNRTNGCGRVRNTPATVPVIFTLTFR